MYYDALFKDDMDINVRKAIAMIMFMNSDRQNYVKAADYFKLATILFPFTNSVWMFDYTLKAIRNLTNAIKLLQKGDV